MLSISNNIIISLDGISKIKAIFLAKKFSGKVWGFKINDLLFESNMIAELKRFGNVFADAKLYDIPNTVKNSVIRLEKQGADIITVHASGGEEMLSFAKKASKKSKIVAVTKLTSFKVNNVTKKEVLKLSNLALRSGIDGIVCSTKEIQLFNNNKFKNMIKIVPGIRPAWYKKKDDQKRKGTPIEALNLGADFIVLGRPITLAKNPENVLDRIVKEIKDFNFTDFNK